MNTVWHVIAVAAFVAGAVVVVLFFLGPRE
jgi:hypothetical protein